VLLPLLPLLLVDLGLALVGPVSICCSSSIMKQSYKLSTVPGLARAAALLPLKPAAACLAASAAAAADAAEALAASPKPHQP
jgi:hypothetical protein